LTFDPFAEGDEPDCEYEPSKPNPFLDQVFTSSLKFHVRQHQSGDSGYDPRVPENHQNANDTPTIGMIDNERRFRSCKTGPGESGTRLELCYVTGQACQTKSNCADPDENNG